MAQFKCGYYKLALLSFVMLLPKPGYAVDATWIAPTNVTGTWSDGPNWTGGTSPNGVADIARFNTEASALITASTIIDTLDLQALGIGETVIIEARDVFTINTTLSNTSNGSFTFESNTDQGIINFNNNVVVANNTVISANEGTVNFNNTSSANGVVFNIQGTNTQAGRVEMNGSSALTNCQVTVDTNAIFDFPNTSTSSTDGSIFMNQNGGETRFATPGALTNVSITNENEGALIVTQGALITSGIITNNTLGLARFSAGGSAGGATYDNMDSTNSPSRAALLFEDDAGVGGLGGTAFITNGNNSETLFSGHSDAEQADITNQANSRTSFQDLATANQATIHNEADSQLLFFDSSTGATSAITNEVGAVTQFSDSSVPGTGTIQNDGSLLFTQTSNTICESTITGTGPVTINMPSQQLTYQTNVKSYSGLTNIQSGTLVGGNTNSFSPNSVISMPSITAAQVNLAGFSQIIGGLSNGSNASLVNAANATLTIDTANPGLVFSGIINGLNGNLIKQGTGKQSLNNDHTYTGSTTVDDGELNVNGSLASPVLVTAGATFSGNATIPLLNSAGGTVSPGNSIGTIITAGNFTLDNASNFILEIAPNFTNDLIQAGLQANLDGTLTIEPQTGSYVFNVQPYTFITTGLANGVNGTFATVTSTSSLTFNVVYGPNYVQLFVTNPNVSLASIPTNHNAHHFLNYITKLLGQIPVGSQLNNAIGALNALPTVNQIGHALEHLEPSPLINFSDVSHELNQASTKVMGLQTAFYRLQSYLAHMVDGFGEASGQMIQGFLSSLQSTTQSIHNQLSKFLRPSHPSLPHGQKYLQATSTQLQMPHDLRAQFGKANIWFQQNGQHFKLGSHGGEHAGILARTHTSAIGMDYKVCDNLLLGMMLSAGRSYLNWEKDRGSGRVSSYHLGIYGSWLSQNKKWYVDFNTVLGRHKFSAHRNIKIPGFVAKGKSNHWGTHFSNDVEAGYTLTLPRQVSLQPYVNLGYFLLGEKGYNEHGAGNAGVHVSDRISQFIRTGTGLEMAKLWACREWIIRPSLRLGYSFQHSLGASKRLRASLIHNPGHFTVTGGRKSHHLFNGAVNINALTKKGLSVGFTYNTQVNSKYKVHEGFIRLGWAF